MVIPEDNWLTPNSLRQPRYPSPPRFAEGGDSRYYVDAIVDFGFGHSPTSLS
jgi:hypothetical protein